MGILVIIMVIVSSLSNMVADVLMSSGKDYKIKNQPIADSIKNTPDIHLILSGVIGAVSLTFWMSVLYYLSYIEGPMGKIVMIAYAAYIGCIMVFHVLCSNLFLLSKHSEMEEKKLYKIMMFYAGLCVLTSSIYSGLMLYLGVSGILQMKIIHYVFLPVFSTGIVQFLLARNIKIKHLDSIGGTISMLVAMLFTINIIITNFNVL